MAYNGGKVCAVFDLALSTFDQPFLNVVKAGNAFWFPQGTVTGDPNTLFDNRGYPKAMPSGTGTTWFLPQIWIYGQAGDTWVLDYPNATTSMSLTINLNQGGFTTNVVSPTRIEYTLTGTPFYGDFDNATPPSPYPTLLCSISITAMAANDFANGGIRLYLKNGSPSGPNYETLLNEGQIFTPRFLSRIGKFGVLHFENWNVSNQGNLGVGKWADRQPVDNITYWGAGQVLSQYYCGHSGTPAAGTNNLTVSQPPSVIASWTQGQKVQWVLDTAPTLVFPTLVTSGSTTTVKVGQATGSYTFSAQPAASSTITLNGTVVTFVTGTPTGNQVQIEASLDATLQALATFANASADAQISKCTYWSVSGSGVLSIVFKTPGTTGNSFTLAASSSPASNATVSGATLSGGSATGHGMSSGQQIQFSLDLTSVWRGLTSATGQFSFIFWTITVVDTFTFTIPFNSTGAPLLSLLQLSYIPIVTLTVGSLPAVPCIQQQYAANFSGNNNAGQVFLANGNFMDGIYDATLNAILCDNQNEFYRQVPIEVCVALCNTTGSHPYFNINAIEDDDFITQRAAYLKPSSGNLDPTLIPRNELSNEVWNFSITGYFSAKALVASYATGNFHNYYGQRISEISNLFKAVYVTNNNSYKILMAVQSAFCNIQSPPFNQSSPFCYDRFIDFPYTGINISSISIASPAVVTTSTPHGFVAGDLVVLTSSTNQLPPPFVDSLYNFPFAPTPYFVLSSGLTATQCQLSATKGGSPINTTGSAGGTITIAKPAITKCDAIVHAPYFDCAFNGNKGPGGAFAYPSSTSTPPAGGWADQIYNYTQGGASAQEAFNYFTNELTNTSQNEAVYNTDQPVNWILTRVVPSWMTQANAYGVDLYCYEGGQNIFGVNNPTIPSIATGFPGTAPTSGQTVTVANVQAFIKDYYQSQQFANLITKYLNGQVSAGGKFPAQYTIEGPWFNGTYWAIQPLNLTTYNGFVNSPTTLAFSAISTFNNPSPGVRNLRGGF